MHIYLDHNATTPLDPAVVDAMLPWLREQFGNPASSTHAFGHAASKAVEAARAEVARLVGAEARDERRPRIALDLRKIRPPAERGEVRRRLRMSRVQHERALPGEDRLADRGGSHIAREHGFTCCKIRSRGNTVDHIANMTRVKDLSLGWAITGMRGKLHRMYRPDLMPHPLQRKYRCIIADMAISNMGLNGENGHGVYRNRCWLTGQ